ncbi:MAG: PaaX family transcriptional regulator [Alcaligenaceae bacterium]|nr:PaaX family transcriptional regulator [Alcaligenaceae bacterium]
MPKSVSRSTNEVDTLIAQLLQSAPLKAAAFIVTLYGDVVEPRGGVLWMGNVIETCATAGISENLVRTAVSRLVAAGQLAGERVGRRSFYRLTSVARTEFAYAARVLYTSQVAQQWCLVYLDGENADALMRSLKRLGYAALNPRLALGPDSVPLPPGALVWTADVMQGHEQMRNFAAAHWDLPVYAHAFQAFIKNFQPVEGLLAQLSPEAALTIRLLMVHQYRYVALRAPHLPREALPENWDGHVARSLFARLYLALSSRADTYVAGKFVDSDDVLIEQGQSLQQRLVYLSQLV